MHSLDYNANTVALYYVAATASCSKPGLLKLFFHGTPTFTNYNYFLLHLFPRVMFNKLNIATLS